MTGAASTCTRPLATTRRTCTCTCGRSAHALPLRDLVWGERWMVNASCSLCCSSASFCRRACNAHASRVRARHGHTMSLHFTGRLLLFTDATYIYIYVCVCMSVPRGRVPQGGVERILAVVGTGGPIKRGNDIYYC
eukprot:223728-Prorocentrum_minimum.AAC.2